MGAEFNFEPLSANNRIQAESEVQRMIEVALYDYGHAGYTGSWAECDGVEFREAPHILNEDNAHDWLQSNAGKWGPALIIQDSKGNYYAGAWCSS